MRSSFIALIATVLLAGPAQSQFSGSLASDTATPGDEIRAENCIVEYIQRVNIPAEAQGKLTEITIKEGMTVKKGDLIAVTDDTLARLNLDLKKAELVEAELNATSTVNLRNAQNTEKLAAKEAEAYQALRREGATPYWEVEKKRLEADTAKLRIELAEDNIKIAKAQYYAKESEMKLAAEEVTRRQIKAPFDGFIETRTAQLGEWVQPGSPIALLVNMDQLRVEGDIDALRYAGLVSIGTPAEVLIYHRGNADPLAITGKLSFVSTEIDLNNRHRIHVTVDNRAVDKEDPDSDWLIKPGMRAEIIIRP